MYSNGNKGVGNPFFFYSGIYIFFFRGDVGFSLFQSFSA